MSKSRHQAVKALTKLLGKAERKAARQERERIAKYLDNKAARKRSDGFPANAVVIQSLADEIREGDYRKVAAVDRLPADAVDAPSD